MRQILFPITIESDSVKDGVHRIHGYCEDYGVTINLSADEYALLSKVTRDLFSTEVQS